MQSTYDNKFVGRGDLDTPKLPLNPFQNGAPESLRPTFICVKYIYILIF